MGRQARKGGVRQAVGADLPAVAGEVAQLGEGEERLPRGPRGLAGPTVVRPAAAGDGEDRRLEPGLTQDGRRVLEDAAQSVVEREHDGARPGRRSTAPGGE